MTNFRIASAFLLFMLTHPLYAGELISALVEHDDDRYVLEFDMRINANPESVYTLITDFDHLNQLNDSIQHSKLVHSVDENNHRVSVTSKACVLFFCKIIRQVQDIEEINREVVVATVIAEQSDFDYAHARWHIRAEDKGTRITFNADLKPSFWVPPLIGPAIIKRKLEDEVLTTIETLEKLAN